MHKRIRAHLQSNLVGYVALFAAMTGTAYAAEKIGSNDITKNAIKAKHVKKNSIKAKHVRNGTLRAEDLAPEQRLPSGMVAFFTLASCPSGWSDYGAARGRYVVGVPSGGTLGGAVGNPLGNLENRPVGRHSHAVTDPGHSHGFRDERPAATMGGHIENGAGFISGTRIGTTDPAQTGISVDPAGSVGGTNAPYLQLRACQKG